MNKEEKQLLLVDLCARLPYGVKAKVVSNSLLFANCGDVIILDNFKEEKFLSGEHKLLFGEFKPYLRSMSSMTEEEVKELSYNILQQPDLELVRSKNFEVNAEDTFSYMDWLNAYHFDYRGLIEKGLALEAPEGIYDI